MSYLEEARKYFGLDRYATQQTGVSIIAAEQGYAKCEMRIDERHKNALGQVMGGVYFTLADYAFAIATNDLGRTPTVTQTSQITYLSAPKGQVLYAETERIRAGRTTCFYKISITDDTGALIAYVTTTGFSVKQ